MRYRFWRNTKLGVDAWKKFNLLYHTYNDYMQYDDTA